MTTVLQQVSDDLTATVEAVSPGLLRVEARRQFPASGMVWSPDGVIVTAHHVIEQDEAVRVGLHGGQPVTATLVGRDATTDLAVLRVATMNLTPPAWAEPDLAGVRVGHLVLAVGRPGQSAQATLGLLLSDTLIALDDTPVRHPDDLLAFLSIDRIGATVCVRLVRGGQMQEQAVVVGETVGN